MIPKTEMHMGESSEKQLVLLVWIQFNSMNTFSSHSLYKCSTPSIRKKNTKTKNKTNKKTKQNKQKKKHTKQKLRMSKA